MSPVVDSGLASAIASHAGGFGFLTHHKGLLEPLQQRGFWKEKKKKNQNERARNRQLDIFPLCLANEDAAEY